MTFILHRNVTSFYATTDVLTAQPGHEENLQDEITAVVHNDACYKGDYSQTQVLDSLHAGKVMREIPGD